MVLMTKEKLVSCVLHLCTVVGPRLQLVHLVCARRVAIWRSGFSCNHPSRANDTHQDRFKNLNEAPRARRTRVANELMWLNDINCWLKYCSVVPSSDRSLRQKSYVLYCQINTKRKQNRLLMFKLKENARCWSIWDQSAGSRTLVQKIVNLNMQPLSYQIWRMGKSERQDHHLYQVRALLGMAKICSKRGLVSKMDSEIVQKERRQYNNQMRNKIQAARHPQERFLKTRAQTPCFLTAFLSEQISNKQER